MKKIFAFLLTLAIAFTLATPAVFAEGETDFVMPGAIVDLTTEAGYKDFCDKAEEFDLVSLTTGEYTVHGTNGKVQWEFMEEDGETFARFTPIEPLNEKGLDADGNRPECEGDFRMTAEIEFPIAEYNYISFCYRASAKSHLSTNHIYIRDDAHYGEFQGTNGMWVASSLKNNGQWNIKTIKISSAFSAASGTFKSIRIPIVGRVGETFDLKYIVVYNEKALCENFDINAYHEALEALATPEPTAEPTSEPTAEPTSEPVGNTDPTPKTDNGNGCGGMLPAASPALLLATLLFIKKRKR